MKPPPCKNAPHFRQDYYHVNECLERGEDHYRGKANKDCSCQV